MNLNEAQRRAAERLDGPLIVAAGPGTGKTQLFAARLSHLLTEKRIPPEKILAVTFTRAAAREMRGRLAAFGVAPEAGLWIDTFHAAALRLLREEGEPFGPGVDFTLLAEEERAAFLEGLVAKGEEAAFLERLRRAKQALAEPADATARAYQERLRAARKLDFDDLFLETRALFRRRPEAAVRWRARFSHVMVDEFQDTSLAQYAFLRDVAGENLCVVGDPDQAIYGFASEGFSPFAAFRHDFPAAAVAPLTENYRSQPAVLDAARQVIGRNPASLPRALEARLERGLPLESLAFATDRQEAEGVARRIESLLGGSSHFAIDSGWAGREKETGAYGLAEMAILYRLNAQARLFETALERAGIPYRTYGKKPKVNGEFVKETDDWEDFRQGDAPPAGEAVTLMTLHRAKGLEFPVVFIAGCEEGLLPHGTPPDMEEERRLLYVGMTRAKQRLFLCHARKRVLFGRTTRPLPSPFLLDIEDCVRRAMEAAAPARKKPLQPTLFDI